PRSRGQSHRGARPLLRLHRRAGLFVLGRSRGVSRARLPVASLFAVAVAVFFAAGGHRYFTFENLKAQQAVLDGWYREHPWQTVLVYFAAYVAVTGLSLPG